MTFEEFKASGRYVEDMRQVCEHVVGDVPLPGRVYAGGLVIDDSLGAAGGAWMLTISNSSRSSDDLESLERDLFEYGQSEGLL